MIVRFADTCVFIGILDVGDGVIAAVAHTETPRPEQCVRLESSLIEQETRPSFVCRRLPLIFGSVTARGRDAEIPVRKRGTDDKREKYDDAEEVGRPPA